MSGLITEIIRSCSLVAIWISGLSQILKLRGLRVYIQYMRTCACTGAPSDEICQPICQPLPPVKCPLRISLLI